MKNQIYVIIDPITDEKNNFYGYLRSIPLIKQYYNINQFTFSSNLNSDFPPLFNFKFQFLNIKSDYSELDGSICQIVNQYQELNSEHDVTHYLYTNFINSNTKLDKLCFVFDHIKFKLKHENNLEDKPFVEDKGLINISYYEDLLRTQFRKEGINTLPISINNKSGNYIIQKMALRYHKKFDHRIQHLAELFDFNQLFPESKAWNLLLYFAKVANSLNYTNIIRDSLRLFIENDITQITQNFYDALKSRNFDYEKIAKWRENLN